MSMLDLEISGTLKPPPYRSPIAELRYSGYSSCIRTLS